MESGAHRPGLASLYAWATERLYNELAWAYDAVSWLVSLGHWGAWRRLALAHVQGRRVLEVGCGTGELLLDLARRGLLVYGLDPSPAMLRIAGGKLARRGASAALIRGRAQQLPFAAGALDAVLATFPANYILCAATLREAARVLRPPHLADGANGGRLIVGGLFLEVHSEALRWLLGGSSRALGPVLARWREAATEAGFDLTVHTGAGRWVSCPVFVLQLSRHVSDAAPRRS
jgi:SAM-dependent methyltransferase